jgi:cyclic-di-AMP phosphodiesterase PgpH
VRAERRNAVMLNLLVIALTVVFVAMALIVGRAQAAESLDLSVGDPSPETFLAPFFFTVEDEAATADARDEASFNVPNDAFWVRDTTVETEVRNEVNSFFETIDLTARIPESELPVAPTTEVPEATTTTVEEGGGEGEGTTAAPSTIAESTTTSTTLPLRELEDHVALVRAENARFGDAVDVFVEVYRDDVDRVAAAQPPVFPVMRDEVLSQLAEQFDRGVRDQSAAQEAVSRDPRSVFLSLPGIEDPADRLAFRDRVARAIADVVSPSLRVNEEVDEARYQAAKDDAAADVEPIEVQFPQGAPIVAEGEVITQVQLDALERAGILIESEGDSRRAIAALGAIAVLLTAFFLWRIAPSEWSRPKHFALLGVLLVMAAAVSRLPELIDVENASVAYALPAVMFGYLAAILYDPRTAVLMAVPMAIFTAISTSDPGLTVYAAAATVAPVAFVSSVSSRRQLRLAVALSAAVLAPLAGATSWMFIGREAVLQAAFFAVVGGVVAGLVAQGLLSFLENLFRVTTTITLLDLTDRNHPALRLIEEEAPGTFNHSILVGTLAGKAARAIGADPLLAQATAFYHDLGKTKQPQFFIENQFGVSNPHDQLAPGESAEIIADHVTEGLRLARQFRLPTAVVDGIRMHHGTGLMRYFYHKALDEDPGADPAAYRHRGEKPRRKEMAILMISDACEAAARALAQQEDPTADSLKKLVDSIVGEKLEDGQLDESALTFGDLTAVKQAIVDALIGYYHTRVPYPGFPGARVETP